MYSKKVLSLLFFVLFITHPVKIIVCFYTEYNDITLMYNFQYFIYNLLHFGDLICFFHNFSFDEILMLSLIILFLFFSHPAISIKLLSGIIHLKYLCFIDFLSQSSLLLFSLEAELLLLLRARQFCQFTADLRTHTLLNYNASYSLTPQTKHPVPHQPY